ncbi:Spindle pole body component [Paramicrosporidium saccamoebae]|uniref:Spindle pole body component n=1 Tax=Paramicrosporidium saccamoebae TaxID=1246581 RepID=A0A2H9TKF7_9FUNG|nr:Spindle pole body component [Paramicrosporidium saccamoebae]
MLLRDLVFALQGMDGSLIRMDERTMKMSLTSNVKVSESVRQLVDKIAECGTLCYRIRKSITYFAKTTGTVRQSLFRAVETVLREYLKTVACFEATVASATGSTEGSTMTLRKTLAWFSETQTRMHFLDSLLRECQDLHGGPLITAVHKYLSHGNADISSIASVLAGEALRPFYATLIEFVRYGNLQDPHHEFFVQQNRTPSESWATSHTIVLDRLPTVISPNLAAKALLAGKTRSFLAAFADADAMDLEVETGGEMGLENAVGQTEDIVALIKKEHQLACQQLSHLLTEKYSMRSHLRAVRDFIYFGRGDFASALIEFSSAHLAKPAASMFRHALVSCLDQALLSLPRDAAPADIRERMDVRLHEATSPKHTGWDVFTLEYRVDFPLDVILTPPAMAQHGNVSHFLWSLRRVYYSTTNCWARVNAMQRVAVKNREFSVDLKRLQLFLLEGASFARKTCEYATAVVHKCWDQLFLLLDKPEAATSGLDYYISAHDRLLAELRNDLFIFYNQTIKAKLAAVLSVLLKSETVVRSYEHYIALLSEHERRQSNVARLRSGSWSILAEDEAILESFSTQQLKLLAERRASFQHAARQFQGDLDELLLQLQKEEKGESPLAMVLDFSGYHKRRNGFDHGKYCAVPK